MQTFGLFVDFDSLSEALGSRGLPVDYDRIARGLKEMAEVFGDLTRKQAHGSWPSYPEKAGGDGNLSLDARTVFARYGYDFGRAGLDELAEDLDDLLLEGRCPDVVVIATGAAESRRLIRTAERLRKGQKSLVLWYVEGVAGPELLENAPQSKSIQSLLDIRAAEVALLVDLENVTISLRELGYQVDYGALASGLRRQAESGGRVLTEAHAFADFDRLPDFRDASGRHLSAMTAFVNERFSIHHVPSAGKDTADMPMAAEGSRLLSLPSSPAIFVIASGDKGFYGLVQEIKDRNKAVEIWGVAGATSRELIELAGEGNSAYIHDLVPLQKVSETRPAPSNGHHEAEHGSEAGILSRQVLPLKTALILEAEGLAWVPFRRLMQEVTRDTSIFHSQDQAKDAINEMIAEGILIKNNLPNPRVPGTTTTALEPNREHPTTRTALTVATRIARLLQEMQARFPFVAFSYFNRTLVTDPVISEMNLSEQDCRNWLNYLVREGAITVAKEDNPVNPQFKVSTLKLNAGHALARMALQPGSTPNEEMRLRVVLTLDHYLTRKGTPWMPMSTLRSRLERFGRMVMEQVLSELQQQGAIITEKYDNPQKEFKTTGCFLRPESDQIEPVLKARRDLLATTRDLLERYPAVPAGLLEERLGALPSLAACGVPARKWLEVLVEDGLLKLQRGGTDHAVVYVLADSDPVILRLFPAGSKTATPVDGDAAWLSALAEVRGRQDSAQA